MKKILKGCTVVLLMVMILTAFGCSAKKDVLVMGTNATFPPFEYIGGANGDEVIGFDVEIAKAIAADLGMELKIEDMEFDTLLTALNANKIDFVVAGMTINPTRAESVNFSEPYYEATQAVLVNVDGTAIASLEELADKKIAVQLGTTGNDLASEYTDEKNISAFNSGHEAVLELKNKKVDALIIDQQPAMSYLAKNPDLAMVTLDFDPEYYGIAIKKGNDDLQKAVNATLAELKSSGKYDELLAKYMK